MTCSAEGYRFLSSNTLDKNVQEIFQIPTVRSDRTRALFNSLHGGGPIRGFVGGLRCGVSTPSVPLRRSETDACGRTCLASFRHSVTKKCHSAAKLLADSASGLLVPPFTVAGHSATDDRHRVGSVSSWAATWRGLPPPVPVRSWRTPPATANRIAADSKRPPLPR